MLAIGLDAVDRPLILDLAERGELPVLARLMRSGATALLSSPSKWMPESAWPTLITGCTPGRHGTYNWRTIQPGTHVRRRTPGGTWKQPFWQLLRRALDARVVLFDVPYTTPLGDARVTEVVGWGERGAVRRDSWPPDLRPRFVERHGEYPRWIAEDYVRWPLEEARVFAIYKRMIARRTDALQELLDGDAWDLCVASYAEPHAAGHAFYRHLKPGSWPHAPRRARRHGDRLMKVYRAVDDAIGSLLDTIPEGTDVVVMSGKGFRINTSGEALLSQLLTALGYHVPRPIPARSRGLQTARSVVRALAPRPIRRRIMGGLPWQERDRLLEQLWTDSTDWAHTRAFAETEPGHGYVRLNVRGREPEGTVEPGPEYDALCREIAEELHALRHARTGAPAVEQVLFLHEEERGPHVDRLPDLCVKWSLAQLVDEVRHPRVGVIRERTRELQTAEHTGEAFFVGCGPSFRPGAEGGEANLVDVAPTVLHILGAPIPADMDGSVLEELLSPSGPAAGPARREPIDWDQDPWALDRAAAPREPLTSV